MASILLSYGRLSQTSLTILGSSELSRAPASNMIEDHPFDLWQTTDLIAVWFEIQLVVGSEWDLIALLYTNGAFGDLWQIRAAATQGGLLGAPSYDTTAIPLYSSTEVASSFVRPALHRTPTLRTEQWIRVDFTIAANAINAFQVGNLIVDQALAPNRNFQYDLELGDPTRFELRFLDEPSAMAIESLAIDCYGDPLLALFDIDNATYQHHWMVWGKELGTSGVRLTRARKWTKRFEISPFVGRDEF